MPSGRTSGRIPRETVALLAACLGLGAPVVADAVTFDDGTLHVIEVGNNYPSEPVFVADGPLGASTILQIVDTGQIGAPLLPTGVGASGFSILSMEGGTVYGSISLVDEARWTMTGGTITGSVVVDTLGDVDLLGGSIGALRLESGRQVTVDGAVIGPTTLDGVGANQLELLSGSLGLVTLSGVDRLEAVGGTLTAGLSASGQATLGFSGANADLGGGSVNATDDVEVEIAGGSVSSPLVARGASTWRVTGGRPLIVDVAENAVFELEGFGFDRPFGDLLETQGVLAGTLPDCSDVEIIFVRADPGVLRLTPSASPLQVALPTAGSLDTIPGTDRGVAESGRGAVSTFSDEACAPTTEILVGDPMPGDWIIEDLEVTPDGGHAVVVAWRGDASAPEHLIWLFDLATDTAIDGVTFRGSSFSGTTRMRAVSIAPSGTRAVALADNEFGGPDAVVVADLFPVAVTDSIPIPAERTRDIVVIDEQNALVTASFDEFSFDPRGIYVVSLALGEVIDQIDGLDGTQIATADEIEIARAEGRAYAEMSLLFATSSTNGLGVIDLATRSVVELLQLPGVLADVTPDGRRLLTLDVSNDEAILADRLADGSYRLDVRPLGNRPRHGALSEDGSRLLVSLTQSVASIALQPVCVVPGAWPRTPAPFAAGEDHFCEDWSGEALGGVDASGAMLANMRLVGADLSLASLTGANLSGSQLAGLDLTGADLTGASLVGAEYDEATVFPSGSTYPGPDWGLPAGATPWALGMVAVPEPSLGLGVQLAVGGLAVAARRRRGAARLGPDESAEARA